MTDVGSARKLASIVAIDVAGYSRRTEADEEAAVKAVAALKTLISKAASAHGGRVFNTAGDGFMLEFPSASSALAAAEEIAAAGAPPVRVGVHLGDVSVTESGDLLGHGVNVAARIQQMAQPGAVLASGDVKRAIRGPLGERLRTQGSVRLDKMSETLPVFALAPAVGGRAKGRRLDLRSPVIVAAAALVLALAGLSLWLGRDAWLGHAPAATRIAVAPFAATDATPALRGFVASLSDQILGALSTRQVPTISGADAAALQGPGGDRKARDLGVRLLIDGSARADGAHTAVSLHFEDPASHATVWSADFTGASDQASALQGQIAAKIAAMLDCASRALRPVGGLKDPAALSSYLKACDLFQTTGNQFDPDPTFQLFAALRRVFAVAPDFAPARSDLAKYEAYFSHYGIFTADQAASLRKESRDEAQRALALDPKDADAYVALMFLVDRPGWAERERLLRKALAVDPDWPHANGFLGLLLAEVGRLREGATYIQRASAANPLSPDLGWTAQSAQALADLGRPDMADAVIAQLVTLWPHDQDVWNARLTVALDAGRWDAAIAVVQDKSARPSFYQASDVAQFDLVFRAAKSRAPDQLAAARKIELDNAGRNPALVNQGILALSALGYVDDAFDLASSPGAKGFPDGLYSTLFRPPTQAMRRDRRFMPLAAKLGLVDYWRSTGKWPDFCSDPGLPYDCKAEAAKAVAAGHG